MRKLVLLAVALLLPSLASAAGPSPRLIAKIRLGVGPCAGVAGFGSFWETSYGTATLSRINPRTNRVTRPGRLGFQPCGIAVGAGSILIDGYGTAKVERVNPKTLRVVKRIRVGIAVWDVAYAFGSVWATNNAAGSVSRIDPATNTSKTVATGHARPSGIVVTADAVWIANADDTVSRLDPATNTIVALVKDRKSTRLNSSHVAISYTVFCLK